MSERQRYRTTPSERANLLSLLFDLAALVESGELTGLAYVAQRNNGHLVVNLTGSIINHGPAMIDALYHEAAHLPVPALVAVT